MRPSPAAFSLGPASWKEEGGAVCGLWGSRGPGRVLPDSEPRRETGAGHFASRCLQWKRPRGTCCGSGAAGGGRAASPLSRFQFVFLIWEDSTRTSKTEMSPSHRPLSKKNL